MSMYRFVKEGSSKRLFVQGTLEGDEKPLKSSLKKPQSEVGSPITTSLNLPSVPRSLRESLTRHETVYDGNYPGVERYRSGSYNGRIVHEGNQTHFEYDGESALAVPTSAGGRGISEMQAIHTNKRLSTEVLGSSLESTKISKKDDSGQRRITTRIVRKVTTLTRGEEKSSMEDLRGREVRRSSEQYRHYEVESTPPRRTKISDIVVGQEPNVTAREALLSWARRSTAKYPGVRVSDFTSSWRDGLAFNALIHRNRPDLIDWRNIRSRQVRERLETAFHVVEKEYGVTRLLDPEDVDTHEPDEKSLITYISSLYETFPEPPAVHPLFDAESQRRAAAYTENAAQHRAWLHEKCSLMQDRAFPSTLIEMKKLLSESTRFRNEEVPLRQRDKQKLFHQYRELEKYFETVGEIEIEPSLRPDALEQAWSRLMMAQQERDRDLADEIRRLERLQRLAEKLHRDIKQTESGLDNVERHIESEIRRVERGVHPAEAKMAAEQIEQELRTMEHTIQEMFQDSQALREGRYPQASELQRRVQQVHDRWINARQSFTGRLVPRLSTVRMPVQQTTVRRETRTVLETRVHDTDPRFQQLHDATKWCKERLKKLHESEYGSDLPSVQHELDKHQREHKQIDQFHSKVEQCVHNRANFSGEELNLYNQHLSQLQKLYADLLSTSTKRISDLDALQDFLQSATAELNWLNEKEQVELSRDWADPHINLPAVQHYYEQLMSSLEKRELQFSNVIDRGEALIAQHHPAMKTIEAHLQVMQSQWAWVLQLTLCLETHLKHTTHYHNFFEQVKEAEKWIQKREEALNTTFSQSEFTLDQGERLLKGMQDLREELNQHGAGVSRLVEESQEIRPVKQRRAPITRPLRAETVCAYKHANVAIEKGSAVTVVDNSGRSRWRVRLGGAGTEVQLPGAVVALPPPCQEAIDAASRLRNAYDRVIQLWQRKQLRMRQNMIFATIKVVKGWDFPQFVAMGAEQRQAIRRALNEDAEKLLAEGDPADPQLRRLRREIDEVNRLFDEFERRARAEEDSKNAARIFTDQSSNLLERLEVYERQLHERIASHIPRDLDSLEHLVLQHKDWETSLLALSSDVEEVQTTFRGIALKTPAMKKNLDKVMGKWNDMQSKSQLFVERLKFVEIVVNSMEDNNQTISEFEIKLAQFNDLPNDVELLKDMHEDLLRMQVAVSKQQIQVDQMNDDAENCRRLVESSRASLPHSSLPRSGKHIDLERLDKEVTQLNNRWNNVCTQLAERLRSCEAAYQLLRNFNAGFEKEAEWIDDSFGKLQAQPPIEIRPKEQFEPTRTLLTSVVERTPKIEKVNVDGGRFIREAKIHTSRCQRYVEWLFEEIHPSLDVKQLKRQADIDMAERLRSRGRKDLAGAESTSGADAVARDLDELNGKHQRLLDMLYERLRRIAAANPGDIVTLRLVEAMAPRSARSFRQEFNMQDVASTEHTYTTHYTSEKYVKTSHTTELDGHSSVKTMTNGKLPNYKNKSISPDEDRPDIRNLKRVHKMYEGPNIIESRGIIHPETREVLTVGQAISMRILDVRTGRLLSSPDTRQTITIEEAAKEGLIDPKLAARLTGPCGMTEDGNEVTLLEAIQRELYDAEQGLSDPAEKRIKQAVEEKYRLCDETLSKLLEWIAVVEERLANQEAVKEDMDELRNQINILKLIKDDLDSHQRQVSACADQAKQLLVSGSDVLAPHEVAALERGVRQLKQRCDKCTDKCDKMLRRLVVARDELGKFTNELNAFNTWMEGAYRTLEDKEVALSKVDNLAGQSDDVRDFVSDVIAHQADLRFITMAAQKFVDESKEFLNILNDYRTSLPARLSHVPVPVDSAVREHAGLARRRHGELASRAQRLLDRLRMATDGSSRYREAVQRAQRWMQSLEPQIRTVLSEGVAGEPRAVESQLSRAKTLHNEILSQGRLIDNVKDACDQLVKSLEGNLTPSEIRQLEVPVIELQDRYKEMSDAVAGKCGELESALLQCQGIQDAAETQANWLNQAENNYKTQTKPASLIRERLEEQIREQRISQAEVEGRRAALAQLQAAAREAALTPSNARIANKLEQRAQDIFSRYEKLVERVTKRGQFLDEVMSELSQFNQLASRLETTHAQLTELDSRDLARMSSDELASRLADLAHSRDKQMPLVEECLRLGKQLVSKKDVTDTHVVRDRMKAIENQWRDFNTSLEEKQKLSKQKSDQLNQYESLRSQVLEWLQSIENRINHLRPVAIDVDVIKQQHDELRPLAKEYRDFSITIDKLNEAGAAYEALSRGDRAESPRRRHVYSPTKRHTPSRTLDTRSPSPGKGGIISPASAHSASSGFSSRRSSQDGFHLEDLSPVQQQVSEVNNRYELVGAKLSDRQSELDAMKEEVKRHLDSFRTLNNFLDKVQRQLPKESVPTTKEEADKTIKQARAVLEEMYEKQSILDSTKTQVRELLKRKQSVQGADRLHDELQDVASRWKALHDAFKEKIQLMEEMKDLLDTHSSLSGWLSAKERMMTALGPISSDSRMVQTQVQQVQVLREEFRSQQPQLSHLVDVAGSALQKLPHDDPDVKRLTKKVQDLQDRWNDLLNKLEQRADSLGAAADTSREFDAGLERLRNALHSIADKLDDVTTRQEPADQLREVENLERQLEGQRPLLADLEAAGATLAEVLGDASSRQDIQSKLAAAVRQYDQLQRKLDNRKAEIEAALKDGRNVEESVARTLGWLQSELGTLPARLLVSADKPRLQQALDTHEPLYRGLTQREHEIIMLLDKGREMEKKPAFSGLRKDLDRIQSQWEKLKRETVDRYNRLQTAMEHCRKYNKAQESFLPWLGEAEKQLRELPAVAFTRKELERQLRDLQHIRNDVWKRSGEYENNRTLGETFISACDVDQEIVRNQLDSMKEKWDRVNNEVLQQIEYLESTSRKLGDFLEKVRAVEAPLARCEERLEAALNSAPAAAKDAVARLTDHVHALHAPLQSVNMAADDIVSIANEFAGPEAAARARQVLDETTKSLADRLRDLETSTLKAGEEMAGVAKAITYFLNNVKESQDLISNLEKEFDAMKPPGRDLKTVRAQIDEISKFWTKLESGEGHVDETARTADIFDDSPHSEFAKPQEHIAPLKEKIRKLQQKTRQREQDLDDTHSKLQAFYKVYDAVIDDIDEATEQVRNLKPVSSDLDQIRAQQKDFADLKQRTVEPLGQNVSHCNKIGQGLVRSALQGVSTQELDKDLEKLNDRWNNLKEKMNERGRRLDVGLLQSGKLAEALAGLARWLSDTEELVRNQKPPSADYKVVKAQLQEQKFLKKMLMDRQNSMSSLFAMGNEVAADCDSNEKKAIEKQLKGLMQRFDGLTASAQQRMLDLEQAMKVAKTFEEQLQPLMEWLGITERKVKALELVPTDEEKIQQKIREHKNIHEDILSKQPQFKELTETASTLMSLVGDDEAAALADRLHLATDRYQALVDHSLNIGDLLDNSRKGLRHLVLTYQDLSAWMDSMEQYLAKRKILPVHMEKLLRQMDEIAEKTEEISDKQQAVDSTVESGLELMKHISGDEALQLKDKLDALQRRYNDLTAKGADLLKLASDTLPLVQQLYNSHTKLTEWMASAETCLQSVEPREQDILRLEAELQEFRPLLDNINVVGPQLCQISPGEGATHVEGMVTRDNRRFDAIAEQVQRKAERLLLSKKRSLEVVGDMEELVEWLRAADAQLRAAEPPAASADVLRAQLAEQRPLSDDVAAQRVRARELLSQAKKVLRECQSGDEAGVIRERSEELKEMIEEVGQLSAARLAALEQALPLAEHFADTHHGLSSWLDDMEKQVQMLAMPALRPEQIVQQQDKNEMLQQSIAGHKPLVDKLVKTGEALSRLCGEDDAAKVQDIVENDCERYNALKAELRQRQQELEQALQESSVFAERLEGMVRALSGAADQLQRAEPVSAHPHKIQDQIEENNALIEDLEKREEAYRAVQRAASDVMSKASATDPAVRDIRGKLEKLNKLWDEVQRTSNNRGQSLESALELARRFWEQLEAVMGQLGELEDTLAAQAPPAAQPHHIQHQQLQLQEIRQEIDHTKPEVEKVRKTGSTLMSICGEPDKPEVKKHIEDLDTAWDNITALYARREENLIDAMEKAMEFHDTLHNLQEFLDTAEDKFSRMGPLGSDIDAVKRQISQLAGFKTEVDPHMVKVEALNRSLMRQAAELTERTSSEQAAAIKQPLTEVNGRWSSLLRGMVERQQQLEKALLRLGQLQHALRDILAWIQHTNDTLDTLAPVAGDPQILEVELAKLKVVMNDIAAHQASVDTLNEAGAHIVHHGTDEAGETAEKLATLNKKWRELQQKARDRQSELEDALREAQSFNAEIGDLLSWLSEVDSVVVASKPVGGLPETATEQLERFMEVYHEIEANRPKVEAVLQQGQEYIKRQDKPNPTSQLHLNLKNLKSRWDNVTSRASDKKIKLEIALKEATEFHEALQAFVDWLTSAEKTLTSAKPVSRVMETLLTQVEEHKAFQKEVSTHRETMLQLDKKGTHLKYFSQKQDVILIKNLLVSVQHRWERVVSKAAERTRALDHGIKEAKEFNDMWNNLMNWLNDTEQQLDQLNSEANVNDPEKIKQRLTKHREFQKALASKQPAYDLTSKTGKTLKDKAPKSDEPVLREKLAELKSKWTTVCSKAVDRQRRLEEALLYSGQFKDAMSALLEWLRKQEKDLSSESPLHGDLDTVMALIEQHKQFEEDLHSREQQMQSVMKTGRDLEATVPAEDALSIKQQCSELQQAWDTVFTLSERKAHKLETALKEAERLHKSVNMLLEWLSDAETKLRFTGQLPEGEQETQQQIRDHERFIKELNEKKRDKDDTISLAHSILGKAHPDAVTVIKHWITIIQSRWDEVWQWAMQRGGKLETHMQSLKDLDLVLEELLQWLSGLETTLITLEAEPLPESIEVLEGLIEDHKDLMEHTQKRQNEVDRVCKAYQVKSQSVGRESTPRKVSAKSAIKGTPGRGSQHDLHRDRSMSPDYYGSRRYRSRIHSRSRRGSRVSPGRDSPDRVLPHYGPRFPAKGSVGAEPEFRSSRVKQLWDKWRHVWLLAWERQRRLHDRLMHLKELQRVSNFSWDEWRKRFLKFMNHKKSRLTDLFRKMDKDNNGMIARNEFIDGIINTKFDTSRLEMGAVADLFDRNGSGLIDWEEFIAALRPDWVERRGPPTDADKIHDEVKRLVMLCTCRQKFRVFQVGEGKYRFGDSQKLRLVRILRSTVMVRVGGGWVALDEFLVKNDPCRAEEFMEQLRPIFEALRQREELPCSYPLHVGSTHGTKQAFIYGHSRSQGSTTPGAHHYTHQHGYQPSPGYHWVRERTARSVPMSAGGVHGRASRSSLSAGTPDSLSDNEAASGLGQRYRKPSVPRSTLTPGGSRPGSRPGSRTGSKPPSRHGSNLSLDSTDDVSTPSRIPMRKVTNTRASLARAAATANKLGVSTPNGGSRPRTPTGILTPASGRYHSGAMYRTCSIPTLSPVPALVSSTHSQPSSMASEPPKSLSHNHPAFQTQGTTKIPIYVGNRSQRSVSAERRLKSGKSRETSQDPSPMSQDPKSDQRSPEDDSSLFSISGMTSDNEYESNISESSGDASKPTQRDAKGSGSFASADGHTTGRSRIPVPKEHITNTNQSRQRTPSGSTTPVRSGQQTAVSRLLRKTSDASDSGTPTTPVTRRTSTTTRTTDKREPFRL
ncbi:microtubule-actin cross-linking factor 1 isoform X20 [Pieris brassicae]|uniref:microtubule-actin cross-linking factor 1 isoform X20 n=1 Tax=Pieris brassicae TaxID=7116 RepID=UPI001E66063F|nr:microtubule-actin cross-linking factor 1 isoform X20 [Pieris brassicae]